VAARNGFTSVVRILIRFGCELEDGGSRGVTALNSACVGGYIDTVVELLDAGADIQGLNLNEDSPLHCAGESMRLHM